jgi:hypothetical protein
LGLESIKVKARIERRTGCFQEAKGKWKEFVGFNTKIDMEEEKTRDRLYMCARSSTGS